MPQTSLLDRVLIDTAVFVYAVGQPHPNAEPCREIVRALGDGRLGGEANVEIIQEFLHQRTRRTGDRQKAVRAARQVAGLCTIHDVTVADMRRALDLFGAHASLHGRDAVHAATALNRGIASIISPDRAFDSVPDLTRLAPSDIAAKLISRTAS